MSSIPFGGIGVRKKSYARLLWECKAKHMYADTSTLIGLVAKKIFYNHLTSMKIIPLIIPLVNFSLSAKNTDPKCAFNLLCVEIQSVYERLRGKKQFSIWNFDFFNLGLNLI